MTINISGEVNDSMVNRLIDSFNQLKDDSLTIYFTCGEGGYTDYGEAVIHFINSNANKIRMIFYGENYSCGMIIFLRVKCEKSVLPDTVGMFHLPYLNVSVSMGGIAREAQDKFHVRESVKAAKPIIDLLKKTGLKKKEITKIEQGKDVYFSYNRMSELVNAI